MAYINIILSRHLEFISCSAVSVDFGILLTFTLNLKIESIFLLMETERKTKLTSRITI